MTSRTRKLACISGLLLLLAVAVPILGDVWVYGHIFVSESDGSVHVYDNTGAVVNFSSGTNAGSPEILTVSGGALAGVDFESIYHLNATDLNSATTGFSAYRFPILDPHTPPTVDFNTTGFSIGGAKRASSIRHDGSGNLFTGFLVNSPNFNLAEYTLGVNGPPSSDPPTTTFSTTFPPEKGESKGALGVAYMDLKASGTDVVYTSRSNCIHVFSVSTLTGSQGTDFIPCVTTKLTTANGTTVFGTAGAFDGVQLLSNGDVLVGVNNNGKGGLNNYVLRFSPGSDNVVRSFIASPSGNNDVAVVLDPMCTTCFWSGSGTNLRKFDTSTCTTNDPCGPPVVSVTTTSNIVNLAELGTVSPAQPAPEVLPAVTVTNSSPQTCTSGNNAPTPAPCAFTSASTGNTVNLTVIFNSPPPTGDTVTLNVRDTTINPAAGANDLGNPCTKTVLVGNTPTNCLVWKFDPSTFADWTTWDMQFATAPSQTPNTRVFLDERVDVTTGVVATIYSDKGASVHSLNEIGGADEGCFYLPPIKNPTDTASLNNPGNITFRFQCTALGTNISTLNPTLSILQISSNGSGTGAVVFPPPGQTGGTTPDYRLVAPDTWGVNVDSSTFDGKCFLATTFDKNQIASSFFAVFGVNLPTGVSCTIPP